MRKGWARMEGKSAGSREKGEVMERKPEVGGELLKGRVRYRETQKRVLTALRLQ